MKNYSFLTGLVVIVLGLNTLCFANPLSKVLLLFQKDLVIDVLYRDQGNLIQGSEVYLSEDLNTEKVLIGKVNAISQVESQMSKLEIVIDKKYKDNIYETTPFVLMSPVFSKESKAYIVAVSSLEESDKAPLKSGASVQGVTFLEYRLAMAGGDLKKLMESMKEQNNQLLGQLEEYIEKVDSEAFRKKIEALVNELSQFSTEQKETFKNEVLPSLRKMVDSIMEQFERQNNQEKSKELEEQLKEIEKSVDV